METGKSPPPQYSEAVVVTIVSRTFPTLPITGSQRLLLAGADHTQQIGMEETYTPTMMKPAR
jgi:hypothetical protein